MTLTRCPNGHEFSGYGWGDEADLLHTCPECGITFHNQFHNLNGDEQAMSYEIKRKSH